MTDQTTDTRGPGASALLVDRLRYASRALHASDPEHTREWEDCGWGDCVKDRAAIAAAQADAEPALFSQVGASALRDALLERAMSSVPRIRQGQMEDMRPVRITLLLTDWKEALDAIIAAARAVAEPALRSSLSELADRWQVELAEYGDSGIATTMRSCLTELLAALATGAPTERSGHRSDCIDRANGRDSAYCDRCNPGWRHTDWGKAHIAGAPTDGDGSRVGVGERCGCSKCPCSNPAAKAWRWCADCEAGNHVAGFR